MHACPIASIHDAHMGSNSVGFPYKFGNCLNKNCFKSCSSTIGSPNRSLHPIAVHWAITSSPKYDSRANFTTNVGVLCMTDKFLYLVTTAAGGTNLLLLIAEDGKREVLLPHLLAVWPQWPDVWPRQLAVWPQWLAVWPWRPAVYSPLLVEVPLRPDVQPWQLDVAIVASCVTIVAGCAATAAGCMAMAAGCVATVAGCVFTSVG